MEISYPLTSWRVGTINVFSNQRKTPFLKARARVCSNDSYVLKTFTERSNMTQGRLQPLDQTIRLLSFICIKIIISTYWLYILQEILRVDFFF